MCLLLSFFSHPDNSLARSQKHSFSYSFYKHTRTLFLPLYSAATPISATRLWLLRALLCARIRAPYIYHVHAAYVYMRDSADCRPVHPPPRLCPWLLHPAIPVCEGGGPRPYAMRDPRAGPSPRTTETRRRMRKRTRVRLRVRGN